MDEKREDLPVQSTLSYGAQLLTNLFGKTPKDAYSKNGVPPGTDSLHTEEFVAELQKRSMEI